MLVFSNLNLRFNPFGELTSEERCKVAVAEVEHLIAPLKEPGSAVQFLADHGRGKTTHLRLLHQAFQGAPYVKLKENEKVKINKSEVNFIDSFELLSKWERRRLYRSLNSFAFTSHQDLRTELERAGFKVVTCKISCSSTEKLLKIFQKRVEHARRGPGALPLVSKGTVCSLVSRYQDDIRAMENDLYGKFQSLEQIKNV